ncbi:MAG: CapA family protein [Chloroherpetonaceae bacterium]|nr:CapA family protein [Chloroherpetonaceae bacterium]MCS7210266.1 CapA family protein [Chloroherpetonaceae bacterium]MDW8019800.1 CapA family protein [Chloroherpetonaceae bacterium]
MSTAAQAQSRAVIAAVGDLMCHEPQLKEAYHNGTYSFDTCYALIAPFLTKADIATGNLETVHAGKAQVFTGYPRFNTPDEFSLAAKRAGFSFLTTANNHAYDRNTIGIIRTLDVLDSLGILHTGTSRSDSLRAKPALFNIRGIKLGWLAYTTFSNDTIPASHRAMLNLYDTTHIKADISWLRSLPDSLRPDKILLSLHWGYEYELMPRDSQRKMARWLFEAGVDYILGSHPHVVQPTERVTVSRNGTPTECFIIYSMGNFLSNQRQLPRPMGIIVYLTLEKDSAGTVHLRNTEYVLTYVHLTKRAAKASSGTPRTRVILPLAAWCKGETAKLLPASVVTDMRTMQHDIEARFQKSDTLFKPLPYTFP